jgi:K+ potassium transporter
LNYAGQAAVAVDGGVAEDANLFFVLCPPVLQVPLVALATVVTIIASQSIISGTFSMTRQAIQLGFDLLYALVIVRLVRRDLVWINVTTHPTADWIAWRRYFVPPPDGLRGPNQYRRSKLISAPAIGRGDRSDEL